MHEKGGKRVQEKEDKRKELTLAEDESNSGVEATACR